jgi:hypothetical protein
MPQPYETVVEFEHAWDAVFEATQRAIGRVPKMVLLAADRSTGRIAVMRAFSLMIHAVTIVIDVGHVAPTRSRVRVWAAVAALQDFFGMNRRVVKQVLEAIEEELAGGTQ